MVTMSEANELFTGCFCGLDKYVIVLSTTLLFQSFRSTNKIVVATQASPSPLVVSPPCALSPPRKDLSAAVHRSLPAHPAAVSHTVLDFGLGGRQGHTTVVGPVFVLNSEVQLILLVQRSVSVSFCLSLDATRPRLCHCVWCRVLCTSWMLCLSRCCVVRSSSLSQFLA